MLSTHRKFYHQYGRHVSGTLDPDKIMFYNEHPEFIPKRFPHCNPEWFKDLRSGIVNNVVVLSWLEDYICKRRSCIPDDFPSTWTRMWEATLESLKIQIEAQTQGLNQAEPSTVLTILTSLKKDPRLKAAGLQKLSIMNTHNAIAKEAEEGRSRFHIPTLKGIELIGDLAVLHEFPGGPLIITYQMLVSIFDKIEAKFSWLYYVLYTSVLDGQRKYSTGQLFTDVYALCEDVYKDLGNEGIRFYKVLEPTLVGCVLQLYDPTCNDHTFLDQIISSIIEKSVRFEPYMTRLVELAQKFLAKHGTEGAPYLLEQYGQEKLHFLPIVSGEAGMKKMFEHGTALRDTSAEAAMEIAADFKRSYMIGYYEKHKILPKVIEGIRLDPRIRELYKAGRPGSIREAWKIPTEAWQSLEYQKNHDFNYFPQLSDLLDDKAITPHLHSIYQLFAQDALDLIDQVKPHKKEHTRLILEILSRPVIDIKEFYNVVETLGYIPKNWAIIQLKAKERELKIEARVFSILTFECRMMASTCERNIGEQILPLFRDQSMTMSGSQLKEKLDSLITLPESDSHTWVRFHMDLEQWNYTFRSLQQSYILDTLCGLFGVEHFRYLPNIFTDSILISANKFTPPGTPDKFVMWDSHAGGNQGILQKLWTIITILRIKRVMHTLDLEHRLTGSGDNQVLFIKLSKDETLSSMIMKIKNQISASFSAVGLSLKLEETWTSNHLTCYQRSYYLDGVRIPGGLKQSGRAFAGSSDINAGLNSMITTAMNGGLSLTEHQSDPMIGPAFALLEMLITLTGDSVFTSHVPREKERLVLLTWLSSDFGFLPVQQLPSFMYAGHQDTLSESLALLKFVWEHYPRYRPYISGAVKFEIGDTSDLSALQLVLEPTALNISRPKLPEAILKSRVEDFLTHPDHVKNQQLQQMFAGCQKLDQQRLASELLKIRPINTLLIHSLFEYSHIGSLLGTLSRFNKISSITQLVGLNKTDVPSDCFSYQVRQLDIQNLKYFFKRICFRQPATAEFIGEVTRGHEKKFHHFCDKHQMKSTCVFSLRLYLISHTYNLGDQLVTGPYTPPPSEQIVFNDSKYHEVGESDILINPSFNIPPTIAELEKTRGCYQLYIGSKTGDPVKAVKLTALEGVEAGTAIKTLLKIAAWAKSTQSSDNVFRFIASELGVRMRGLEELVDSLVPGTAGGNINHRFGGPGSVMWAYANSLTLITTWYQLSTNRATALQRGEEDRFIFFQQAFHHIYSSLRFCTPYNYKFTATIRLDHCSYLIPVESYDAPHLILPGLDKLYHGLILDSDRKAALLAEADHYQSVMNTSILPTRSGEEVLAAVLGAEVANKVIAYSMGITTVDQETHRLMGMGTTINLSIMRKVSLRALLMSVTLHLALTGFFGRRTNPLHIVRVLSRRSRLGSMGQSATPLVNLLNALITSGFVSQLLQYSQSIWEWDGSRSTLALLTPLLAGMRRAVCDWLTDPWCLNLLVEVKETQYNYSRLLGFLWYWSRSLKRLLSGNKHLEPLHQIRLVNSMSTYLKVIMITDLGIATEYGRRVLAITTSPDTTSTKSTPSPVVFPNFVSGSSINWLRIPMEHHSTTVEVNDKTAFKNDPSLSCLDGNKNFTWLTRWNSGVSNGAPKIASIISQLGLPVDSQGVIITLAEGLGSYLAYLLHQFPAVVALYNSKVIPDNLPPAMAGLYVPPALQCCCSVSHRVLNLPGDWTSYGDLTQAITWEELNKHKQKIQGDVFIMTLDMENSKDLIDILTKHLSTWLLQWAPHIVILKLFPACFQSTSLQGLSSISQHYQEGFWVKPTLSNPQSTEVYLVLRGFNQSCVHNGQLVVTNLISEWSSSNWRTSFENSGQILVDEMEASWKTSYCPSFLTQDVRQDIEEMGSIMFIIVPYLQQLHELTIRRYMLGQTLGREEQTVMRSSSAQSTSSFRLIL